MGTRKNKPRDISYDTRRWCSRWWFLITDTCLHVDIHARRSKHVRRANQARSNDSRHERQVKRVKSRHSTQTTTQVSQVKEVDTQVHPFTPKNVYTNHLLHQAPFTPPSKFTPSTFCTKHLLHQKPFTGLTMRFANPLKIGPCDAFSFYKPKPPIKWKTKWKNL